MQPRRDRYGQAIKRRDFLIGNFLRGASDYQRDTLQLFLIDSPDSETWAGADVPLALRLAQEELLAADSARQESAYLPSESDTEEEEPAVQGEQEGQGSML